MAPVGGSGEAKAGESGEWEISVVAEYPAQGAQRVRRHRTWRVPAADSAAAEAAGASTGERGRRAPWQWMSQAVNRQINSQRIGQRDGTRGKGTGMSVQRCSLSLDRAI